MSKHLYHLPNIRNLLSEGFTAEEMLRLCFDVPDFRPIYDQLTSDINKTKIIDLLVEHADRKLLFETLLTWAKKSNPARYEQYQPYHPPDNIIDPTTSSNPFHYGGPVPPKSFIGHQKAANFCRERLTGAKPINIAVNGERRIGKTSLLHYLSAYAPEKEWGQHVSLYLDCGILDGNSTLATVWQDILYLLQENLEPASPISNQVAKLLEQPHLTNLDFGRLLKMLHQDQPKKRIFLLLDEFELIFEHYNQSAQDLLKGLKALSLMPENNFIMVTATRAPLSVVCVPFKQAIGVEFQNIFVPCELEPFDKVETQHVVETLLTETNLRFTAQELDYIWEISQGQATGAHPIFVQVAASVIFEHKKMHKEPIDRLELERQFEKKTRLYR